MQLSRPLWVVLATACALLIWASSNALKSSTSTVSSQQARRKFSGDGDVCAELGTPETTLPASTLLAFVGVFTASKAERRQALRSTWFPSESGLARFEADTNIRMRFVVGLLQDPVAQAALHEEQQAHKDFLVVNVQETYNNLVLKVYTFLQDVQAAYNPAFIIKTDDDLYIRPDRLAQAIPQWQERDSGYIGVMRVGTKAYTMTNSPWYEPLSILYNGQYHMYAMGGMYALSSEAVQLLTRVPLRQRRVSGGGEDVSIGLWVMGYNITYLDDRRLGVQYSDGSCPDDFIVLTGGCNGLCESVELVTKLHQDVACTKPVDIDLPMMDAWYDLRAVECIKTDGSGNVNKTGCLQ